MGQDDPFFWDTVQLGSKHAHFFFESGLKWAPLPSEIDSGHPPVFGYYLAFIWAVFGKSLPVSHWAMAPFLAGIAWLALRIGRRIGGYSQGVWLFALLFLDPVLAGQSTLISPDIPLACCLLLAVEGLMARRRIWVVLAVLGLCSISTRGMMTAAALFVWQTVAARWPDRFFYPGKYSYLTFLPGAAFAAGFLWWHFNATGWVGYHAGSPWSTAFAPAQGVQLLRNIAIVAWRWADMGRIFEWLALAYLLYKFRGVKQLATPALLFICLLLFLTPTALLYQNLSAHRYFLPIFMGLHLLFFHSLFHVLQQGIRKNTFLIGIYIALATGNCWVYPQGISMDWDATLAYLPYHRLRADMVSYLDRNRIDFKTVGSDFPNLNNGENLLLNADLRAFSERDFKKNTYILASNIFNDLGSGEYLLLKRNWQSVRRMKHAGVWMELFRKKD